MTNEIKEILDKLKDDDWYDELDLTGDKWIELEKKETTQLLDYITNLQEENERLKNGYCELKIKCNNGECDCTNEEYDEMVQTNMRGSLILEDYKSRIDKALAYIISQYTITDDDVYLALYLSDGTLDKLKQILKGEDK